MKSAVCSFVRSSGKTMMLYQYYAQQMLQDRLAKKRCWKALRKLNKRKLRRRK